jgi:transposase-like protein
MPVRCLYCQSNQVTQRGKTKKGKQRYCCHTPDCAPQSFLLDPADKGRLPESKQQVIEMRLNASGVRDTARVLQMSTSTVINELKKKGLRSNPSIRRCWTPCAREPWTSSSAAWTKQQWMKCGALSARSRTRDGCGIRSTIGRGPSWRMWLAGARMRSFSS